MELLKKRCAEYPVSLTLGLERWEQRIDLQHQDDFNVGCSDGGSVVCLDKAHLKMNGKATVNGKNSFAVIGDGAKLYGTKLQINGENNVIAIGPHCRLKGLTIAITGQNCLVAIGKGTTWESGAAICTDGCAIIIGDDCMFSNAVVLRVSDGHSIWEEGGTKLISRPSDVVIHPHVWLGNGARVNKGAVIGTGAIVGQMSLVSGSISPHCIYGGVSAKLLRENVEWSRTTRYNDIPMDYRIRRD